MTDKANPGQAPENTPTLDVIMREGLEQFDVTTPNIPQGAPDINNPDAGLSAPVQQDDALPAAPAASPPAVDADLPLDQRYKNLQAAFTRTAQELADIKAKENSAQEAQRLDEARNLAASEFKSYAAERRAALLTEIDALDPDMDDFRVQVAKLQAGCDRDIMLAGQKVMSAAPSASAASRTDPPASGAPTFTREEILNYVREKVTSPEIGLAPDDKYFWMMCSQAPAQDAQGKKITLDEQIAWAAEQTKQYHAQIAPPDPAQIAAQVNASQPLTRGGGAPPLTPNQGTERDKPMSISEAVEEANNLRRL